MAKVMTAKVKLQCPGGQATPAPPVGPALGQHGVNIGQFVMQFNERTKEMKGTTIPVEITIYSDRSFEFITKSPPAAVLLKQAAGIASGSAEPHKTKVGTVTAEQVRKIAETKFARPQRPRPRPRLPDHRRHGPEHGGRDQGLKSESSRSGRCVGRRPRDGRSIAQVEQPDRAGRVRSLAPTERGPRPAARRDRPPATGVTDKAAALDGRKERRLGHTIRSVIAPCARRSRRRPGPAGRGGQAC